MTEPPEFESPVAKILVDRYKNRINHPKIEIVEKITINPFEYSKRETNEVMNIGGDYFPIVISDMSMIKEINKENLNDLGFNIEKKLNIWTKEDTSPDFIFLDKKNISNSLQRNLKIIVDYNSWIKNTSHENTYPLILFSHYLHNKDLLLNNDLNFLKVKTTDIKDLLKVNIKKNIVIILESNNDHFMVDMRSFFFSMMKNKIPVILSRYYNFTDFNQTRIYSSTDLGGLFIQGFGDGIFIKSNNVTDSKIKKLNNLSFKILQAARVRVTSTDFISCPSCGRTLFDLTETTARIRDKTNHLKGLKIGIMGCIVNGPGEMADADYGYVGSGKEKITLYRGKEVVKRSVHFNDGVDELIKLIKEDGNWIEPKH